MYESFFGLRERPFDLNPNPRFLLMTPSHREALANLQYGLTARKGLTVLIGEAGSGKTTLIHAALREWEEAGHRVAHLSNPTLTRAEFFEYLTGAFGMSADAGVSKARFLAEFLQMVTERHARGELTGLVIDEAQSLSDELLEEVRLLINAETSAEKLFQVLLVGQPELGARLSHPSLRQIKQRIALRCTLSTLDVRQVAAYISGRIQIAGGVAGQVFTREAVMAIHAHSSGIPRVISVICDNALLAGFAAGVRPVTSALVEEVCAEFGIDRAPGPGEETFEPLGPKPGAADAPDAAAEQKAAAGSGLPHEERVATRRQAGAPGLFQHFSIVGKRRFSFF
jgi:type II secretory pathway predicted ATPase ExeA